MNPPTTPPISQAAKDAAQEMALDSGDWVTENDEASVQKAINTECASRDERITELETEIKHALKALAPLGWGGDLKLFKAGGAGGQDQYAGMPPAVRYADAAIMALKRALKDPSL